MIKDRLVDGAYGAEQIFRCNAGLETSEDGLFDGWLVVHVVRCDAFATLDHKPLSQTSPRTAPDHGDGQMEPIDRTANGSRSLKARRRTGWLRAEFTAFAWILLLMAVVLLTLFLR